MNRRKTSIPKKPTKLDGRTMKLARNTIRDGKGSVLKVRDLLSAFNFVKRFFSNVEEDEAKGGYRKYLTKHGPSSVAYVLSLPTQGLLKTLLVLLKIVCDRAATGDPEAETALAVMKHYFKDQQEQSRRDSAQSHIDALREMGVKLKLDAHQLVEVG